MKVAQSLALAELQPGMRIALAVTDDSGRLLVPSGAEVSDSMISSLARRGIESVTVDLEVEEDPAAREAYRQRMISDLDHLFRQAGDSEATRQVYQAVLHFRLENR